MQPLLRLCKSFMRTHLDSCDNMYNKLENNIESLQYNFGLAIMEAIIGIFRKSLFQELKFEYINDRRRFYKVFGNESQRYLYDLISTSSICFYSTRVEFSSL